MADEQISTEVTEPLPVVPVVEEVKEESEFDPSKIPFEKTKESTQEENEAAALDALAKEQLDAEAETKPVPVLVPLSPEELYANQRTLLRQEILDGVKSLLKNSGMDTQQQDKFCVELQKLIGN